MATSVASAPQPTPQQPPQTQGTALPPHRMDAFRREVAARLRAGVQVATVIAEQQALVRALAQPEFEQAMAAAFQKEMSAQQPKKEYVLAIEDAKRQTDGILRNRIRDAKEFIELLHAPEFIAAAQAEAQQPAPAATPYDLPADKKEEIIRRLVQPQDKAGAEPGVHVAASALGHRITHQALANIFRPSGELRAPLLRALTAASPHAEAGSLDAFAANWLKTRHDPAHSIADGLKADGELYKEAMRQAEAIRAPSPAPTTPTLQVAAGTTHTTKLAEQPSLAMDNL